MHLGTGQEVQIAFGDNTPEQDTNGINVLVKMFADYEARICIGIGRRSVVVADVNMAPDREDTGCVRHRRGYQEWVAHRELLREDISPQ